MVNNGFVTVDLHMIGVDSSLRKKVKLKKIKRRKKY